MERVLVTILGDADGLFGSKWETELIVGNPTAQPVVFGQPNPFCQLPGCGFNSLAPRSFLPFRGALNRENPGEMFVVERRYADYITWFLRSYDISRTNESFGTALPVVLERNFLREPTELVGVPTSDRFRLHLRIYDPYSTNAGSVRIIFRPLNGEDILAETSLNLRGGSDRQLDPLWWSLPSYAELRNFTATFPRLRTSERVRVWIQPSTPGLYYYAFITVTNNATQEFTVIKP